MARRVLRGTRCASADADQRDCQEQTLEHAIPPCLLAPQGSAASPVLEGPRRTYAKPHAEDMVVRSIPQRRRRPGDERTRDAAGFARAVSSRPREDDTIRTNPVAQQRTTPSARHQPRLDILTEPPKLRPVDLYSLCRAVHLPKTTKGLPRPRRREDPSAVSRRCRTETR